MKKNETAQVAKLAEMEKLVKSYIDGEFVFKILKVKTSDISFDFEDELYHNIYNIIFDIWVTKYDVNGIDFEHYINDKDLKKFIKKEYSSNLIEYINTIFENELYRNIDIDNREYQFKGAGEMSLSLDVIDNKLHLLVVFDRDFELQKGSDF